MTDDPLAYSFLTHAVLSDHAITAGLLKRSKLPDPLPDPSLNDLARIAATVCGFPLARIDLIVGGRPVCVAQLGVDSAGCPLSQALCPLVLDSAQPLFIADVQAVSLFHSNPAASGLSSVRSFAGVPLVTAERNVIGALCVADNVPRELTAEQITSLEILGRQIVAQIELCTVKHSMAVQNEAQKRAADKEHFLAASSAAMASSLDYETTLSTVANLAVPHLADWCVVHVADSASTVRQLAVAHADPDKVRWAQELQTQYPYDPNAAHGVPNVLRTGKSEFYPSITDAMLAASARDAEHLRIMRDVGFTSVMIVPMIACGQVLGAITFVSAESGRQYDASDIAVAEDLAHSAALAVDNARSFRAAQHEILRRQETEARLLSHQEAIEALNARLRLSVEVTHHHVRNNLQIIMALTQLPIEEGKDTVSITALGRIEHHTCSLAAIHDLLMEKARENADVERLSAHTALGKLIPLLQATARGREIRCKSDDVVLPVQEIGSLCILVNELITNAIKHGEGAIHLTLASRNDSIWLEVCDEGGGFPAGFDWRSGSGTGLCLVDIAGRHDLRGRVSYENRAEGGGRVVVEFPASR